MDPATAMTEGFPRKFGKYQLLAPLAQGGMGALYLATTGGQGMEKLCVIKTVLPMLADKEYIARFRDEAKVVVKLSHGNLVPVFDAGEVDGEMFLAMDFVEGKDLRAVWNTCARKRVAFPVDVAVYLAKELARGLGHAHSFRDLRLVHRDISPPNVLVSFTGEVKITDFGLASSTLKSEKTAPGVIYGKVSYMSPEQARGEPLDGRSDLYAAGIILWELLTGRQLFPAGKLAPHELLQRAKEPHPEAPSARAARVPKDLDALVLKALAMDRDERYQTGEEMREALAGWLAMHAPGTDPSRLERFVLELFSDTFETERLEREALVRKAFAAPAPKSGTRPGTGDGTAPGVNPVPRAQIGAATIVTSQPAQTGSDAVQGAAIGAALGDRYRLLRLIGEGGMGRVYEAEHIEIGRRVAVKILHPAYSRSPDLVARFRREARAASTIGHPNIVDVTDSGTTDEGSVYFVMEFLEGVELGKVIEREGPLEIDRALRIGCQICRAVAAAHKVGIIHRDLKPENVFLLLGGGATDFVKVLDFGIAKTMEVEEQRKERLTTPGVAMGTPEYMAPEQAAGHPADPRTDVYSVGAILYEMLAGAAPYSGSNFMEILSKKATVDPTPLGQRRPEVSEDLERVVTLAMARDPSARPQSLEELEYELNKCAAGRPVAVARRLGLAVEPMPASEPSVPTLPRGTGEYARLSDVPSSRVHSAGIQAPLIEAALARDAASTLVDERSSSRAARWTWAMLATAALALGVLWLENQTEEPPPIRRRVEAAKAKTASAVPENMPTSSAVLRQPTVTTPSLGKDASAAEAPDAGDKRRDPKPRRKSTGPVESLDDARLVLDEARAAEAQMRWIDARDLYQRVSSGTHASQDGLLGLANVAFQTGRLEEAVRMAKLALAAGAGHGARMLLGHAYYKQGRYSEAATQYRAVLKKNPEHTEAQEGLRVAEQRQRALQ